jgi:hypothetical protein
MLPPLQLRLINQPNRKVPHCNKHIRYGHPLHEVAHRGVEYICTCTVGAWEHGVLVLVQVKDDCSRQRELVQKIQF